ncbi:uncharacterized protein LOC126744003 [Anthonomus grandis grandis]|uniref:uncharacterized protein LOC126744003 n=1 Tax=Anthonomus grandis grandis TaxID=2921223 RepID=UPI0021653C92|nr:uncharacterized protein LOC126744003 [Anthonomus grandis grandis]
MGFLNGKCAFMALVFWLSTLECCHTIMVEFGTSKGPIIPKDIPRNSIQQKTIVPRSPAPVREERHIADTPNPNQYQPPVPHQYRTKIYSFKPNPNLILGTPLDQKYTPSLPKYNLQKKQYSRSLGLDYTGPHLFEVQPYQYYEVKKTTLQPSTKYREEERIKTNKQAKYVPQIGVVYSGGVRYYVPQIVYLMQNKEAAGEEENSVYDKSDEKYFIYNRQ